MAVTLPARPGSIPPLVVDPVLINDYADDLLVASSQIDDLGTFVAQQAKVPAWQGDAGVAYHQGIAPIGARADALSLALRAVAVRVDQHGARMSALLTDRADLVERRVSLMGRVTELEERLAAGIPADQEATFQARCTEVQTAVTTFDGDVTAWAGRVTTEEDEMVAAFAAVATSALAEEKYAGVADPADAALAVRPPDGSPAAAVDAWWDGLSPAQRAAVIAAAPTVIGNLHGIPAADRDAANRLGLGKDLSDLRSTPAGVMTDAERKRLAVAEATEDALSNDGRRDPVTNAPIQVQLHTYLPSAFGGDGAVAIAAGDLDAADHVAVVVSGLQTDGTSIGGYTDKALDLYDAARSDEGGANGSVSVLAWLGYDAPDFGASPGEVLDGLGVTDDDKARAGGEALADLVDGLRESRDDRAHLTVIGHSYGSTTAAFGASGGMAADDLVLAGSPGAGDAQHARDLRVEDVWVINNSRDPVAELGDEGRVDWTLGLGLGRNPAEDAFGAERLQGESTHRWERPGGLDGLDPTAPYDWTDPNSRWDDHLRYFDVDTESLHNMAQVVNGDDTDTLPADPVHDPAFGAVEDPEWDRAPTAVDTDGDGDTDGRRR